MEKHNAADQTGKVNDEMNYFAGIPTPQGQEAVTATDLISEAVENAMDRLSPGGVGEDGGK